MATFDLNKPLPYDDVVILSVTIGQEGDQIREGKIYPDLLKMGGPAQVHIEDMLRFMGLGDRPWELVDWNPEEYMLRLLVP